MNFDLEYIEKLVKMVSDSELTELTLEEKRISNCNKKRKKEVVQAQTILPQAVAALLLQCSLHKYLQQQKRKKRRSQKRYTDNISYGRYFFYMASSPGAKPFC